MTARILTDDDAGRVVAIEALRRGRLVALPTDTVYGLAVALDADNGLGRLFAAKDRPLDRAIVLLLADHRQAETVGVLDPAAHVLAAAFWPGGLTLVVPQRPDAALPAELTGGSATIGLRLPAHDAPRAIALALGPLPVTSANRSGEPPATDAAEVLAQLGDPRSSTSCSTVAPCPEVLPRRSSTVPAGQPGSCAAARSPRRCWRPSSMTPRSSTDCTTDARVSGWPVGTDPAADPVVVGP